MRCFSGGVLTSVFLLNDQFFSFLKMVWIKKSFIYLFLFKQQLSNTISGLYANNRYTLTHGKNTRVSAYKYTVSQHGLATIMHRYIFILSVPMVTTEIEFPLELWYSDSLLFGITNEKEHS